MRYTLPPAPMLVIAALAAALAACVDDVTDPDALMESVEAEAVMRSADQLPALGDLVRRDGVVSVADRALLDRAYELWAAGATGGDPRAQARRRLAAGYAAPVLTRTMAADEWARVRDRTDDWVFTAERMLRHLAMPSVEARIHAARQSLARADAATTDESRVYHLLLAGSELVETTPRFVARTLAADAAAAVRSAEARADGPSAASLRRARRLADWAARAAEEGDHMRAIQRAYYAIQLAEGR